MQEKVRRAATVVLHRDGEVFLVERSPSQRYFPGVWAFPGGKVDDADGADEAQAFRRAALRELDEETGLRVEDAARLVPAGRLLTPPFGPVRFDTQFFALALAPGEEPGVVPGELVAARWARPDEAVRAYENGLLRLAPPTLAVLRRYAAEGVEAGARGMVATDGLPHDARFRIEVAPGVCALPLRTRTLPPATTTNAVVYAGERALVVDPAPSDAEEQERLLRLLRDVAAEGRRVAWVALTHHHPDHVGAVERVAREFGAEVCAHAETAKRVPFRVDRVLDDGDAFDLGVHAPSGKPWRVEALHTPGHAPGHLAFVDRRWDHVAAGDLVSGVSTILVDPDEGDMAQYFASLARLAALDPSGVLPAHGPPQVGGGILTGTLEHRSMREARVVDAVAKGLATVETLLPVVYDDAPQEVWPLAARNLRAHLAKLEAEGRVRRSGERWRADADTVS